LANRYLQKATRSMKCAKMCWMPFVATSIRKSVASTVEHFLDLGVKLQDH
jgi:hypothetical protein